MLDTFLINLGIQPIFDPFPHIDEERYKPLPTGTAGIWRGEARMEEALAIIKRKPGSTHHDLRRKMGIGESQASRITRRLRDNGRIRAEWSGSQQEPRRWYAK